MKKLLFTLLSTVIISSNAYGSITWKLTVIMPDDEEKVYRLSDDEKIIDIKGIEKLCVVSDIEKSEKKIGEKDERMERRFLSCGNAPSKDDIVFKIPVSCFDGYKAEMIALHITKKKKYYRLALKCEV